MPFIPGDGRKKGSSLWLENKKRKSRLPGKPLKEGLQSKQLNAARKLLRSALVGSEQERAEAAARALLQLPESDKEKALCDINSALDGTNTEAVRGIKEAQTLCFILMKLNEGGWAALDAWGQTQPLLERHSKVLASHLTLGSMNGTELIALETLGFLASCGAHSYDAATLKSFLNRFIEMHEAFPEYYYLTELLAMEGPEDLSSAADEMEEKRIESCISRLDLADDRQFEAAAELVMLFAAGRQYLRPQLEEVRDEMLDLMQNPDVATEEYKDENDAEEEAERVKQEERRIRSRAAEVLRLLQEVDVPISLAVDGDGPEELKKAEKLFTRLAAHGVTLHLEIENAAPETAMEMVPSEYMDREPEEPELQFNPQEPSMLLGLLLSPPGETEEEALANQEKAVFALRQMQARGVPLEFGMSCPGEHDPEGQASNISEIIEMLKQKGLDVKINLVGENSGAVKQLLGDNPSVTEAQPGEYMDPEEVAMLLQTAMFPQGDSQEEAEARRAEAISRLRPLQEAGLELHLTVEYSAENDAETVATMLGLSLDIMEMNGVYPIIHLAGENAQEIARHMKLDAEE